MRDQLAEGTAEPLLLGLVEMALVAEEDHAMAQERLPDLLHGLRRQAARQLHARDLRADTAADGMDLQVSTGVMCNCKLGH